jgi:hypothetical protein
MRQRNPRRRGGRLWRGGLDWDVTDVMPVVYPAILNPYWFPCLSPKREMRSS